MAPNTLTDTSYLAGTGSYSRYTMSAYTEKVFEWVILKPEFREYYQFDGVNLQAVYKSPIRLIQSIIRRFSQIKQPKPGRGHTNAKKKQRS